MDGSAISLFTEVQMVHLDILQKIMFTSSFFKLSYLFAEYWSLDFLFLEHQSYSVTKITEKTLGSLIANTKAN